MKIYILGNSAMTPTLDRNPFSALIDFEGNKILIDCGEGTQQQLKKIKISPPSINKIILTHLHGDHLWGLFGLIQSIHCSIKKEIMIYGPKGTEKLLKYTLKPFINLKLIKIQDIKKKIFIDEKKYQIEAKKLDHTTNCLGYSFIEKDKRKINLNYTKKFNLIKHKLLGNLQKGEDIIYKNQKIKAKDATKIVKGKKITFILDTKLTKNCTELAKDSNILICESTFAEQDKDKAKNYKHLTARQAASIAKNSNTKKLILTHFSQRYKNTQILEKEAKKIFKNTKIAKELEPISL